MTKEAKLQAAMRILPEWVGYDEEIKALQQKIENANRQTEKDSGKLYIYIYCIYVRVFFFIKFLCLLFIAEIVDDVLKHEEL